MTPFCPVCAEQPPRLHDLKNDLRNRTPYSASHRYDSSARFAVLQIRDVYPGSRIRNFTITDPGSTSKNFNILTQKMVSMLLKYDPSCSSRIWIPDPDFLPIPDPGVKKAPYFGSRIRKTVGLLVERAPQSPLNISPDYSYLHRLLQ